MYSEHHGPMRVGAVMTRVAGLLVAAYLAAAVTGRLRERMGMISCACAEDCWCHKPGLSLFRWVFPRGHTSKWDAEQKAELDVGAGS